jgi:hypothetical protein
MSAAAPREWHQEPVVGRIDNSIRRAVLVEPSSWGFRSRGVRAGGPFGSWQHRYVTELGHLLQGMNEECLAWVKDEF